MADEKRHVWVVFTNAVADEHDEFNRWYDEEHVPDILKVPGFVSGQRFRLHLDQRTGQEPPWQYLTVYESVGDVQEIHDYLARTGGTRTISPALNDDHVVWVYSSVGERVEAEPSLAESS